MKKFVAGILVGVVFATAGSVMANSKIGKQVQAVYTHFNLYINGEDLEFENPPLTVNGSSYVPVRELAGLLGFEVDYADKTRTIILSNQTGGASAVSELDEINRLIEEEEKQLAYGKKGLAAVYEEQKGYPDGADGEDSKELDKHRIAVFTAIIEVSEKKLAELEARKAILEMITE